ncbi:MAG: TonB-dependent receptor; Outer membrane receptor for ferrienterochelin and colicins [uncultured Gemmatimonadetes bacterium]|uniref:TonB-dependent receptor Outer membrane receptor for ferrienterochelin and colicins n=1 Tax=uncultured Gemmatimonadota bacterium TaxID=203437 RepID=A0A6J4MXR4_9BACT|nr:MAG: TonB-dependent receptor; Outer membrane receptor for ferrienterochelin and colicins [uncultured Gemmatimonadota bacterium]
MSHLRKLRSATLAVVLLAACDGDPTSGEREPRFSSVSAGPASTCALTREGEAYCWGNNSIGQIGLGYADTVPVEVPRKVLSDRRFRSIHAGYTTCAVDLEGALHCWGGVTGGVVRGPTPMFPETRFAAVAPHFSGVTCGVTSQGGTVCWGYTPSSPTPLSTAPGTEAFREVSVGSYIFGEGGSRPTVMLSHGCAVTHTAQGHCWGNNSRGQLGTGDTAQTAAAPVRVAGNLAFRTIQTGAVNTCGLDVAGSLYCWGEGVRSPQPRAAGLRFESMDVGSAHACAVTADGQAYCWGNNANGELGTSKTASSAAPEAVVGSTRFRSVSAASNQYHYRIGSLGTGHTCAVGQDERIYCWGDNSRGQLGRPGRESSGAPLRTAEPVN